MSNLSISVILPTFNGSRFLRETLESIASQCLAIDQLVCSDDNSSDDTVAIIEDFASSVCFEVVCLHHKPDGITANYLNALSKVTGNIVLVADQDDIWLENKTRSIVEAMRDETVSLVSHDCLLVDESLTSLGKTLRRSLSQSQKLTKLVNSGSKRKNLEVYLRGGIPLLAHTLAFRSKLIPFLLAKPESIGEWWFEEWVSNIALTNGRLHLIADHLVLYRQHNQQSSGGRESATKKYTTIASGVNKYGPRIQRMKYCSEIARLDNQLSDRYRIFDSYVVFLQARQSCFSNVPFLTALETIFGQFLKGNYRRYSNGFLSIALDILTRIKTNTRR